jgi:anti-anti-sigma regulatory factor
VRSVDAVGAGLLQGVLVDFRTNARQLTLSGVKELQLALASRIENGRRDPSDACWLLKLETLLLLGQQEQFEDLAIDYCVTYERSPPWWEPLPDSIRIHSATPGHGVEQPAVVPTGQASGVPVAAADETFALAGEIDGRPEATFKSLLDYAQSRAEIVIDCRRLRRIDFACAGEMLNEAATLRTAGKTVAFKDLSCLVACMMMVMGMQDLAELNLRTP